MGKLMTYLHGNYIAVRLDKPKEKTDSGLFIPEHLQVHSSSPSSPDTMSGKIVHVGEGMPGYPLPMKIGDTCITRSGTGFDIRIGNEVLRVLLASDMVLYERECDE